MWSKYDRGTVNHTIKFESSVGTISILKFGNGNSIGLFLIEIQATKWRKFHLSSTIAAFGDPTLLEKEKVVDCTNVGSLKSYTKHDQQVSAVA